MPGLGGTTDSCKSLIHPDGSFDLARSKLTTGVSIIPCNICYDITIFAAEASIRRRLMISTATQRVLDRLAIGASALCTVHCLLTPVLIVLVPMVASSLLADEVFHRLMLLWVWPTSALALWIGCRRHRDRWVLLLGGTGLAILTVTAFWGHALLGEVAEKATTIVGSLAITAGHWLNYRQCRKDACAHA